MPIYQRLPRYGESWRDRLIRDGLMISVDAFNKISRPMTVSRLIYEKPEGRLFKLLVCFLVCFRRRKCFLGSFSLPPDVYDLSVILI